MLTDNEVKDGNVETQLTKNPEDQRIGGRLTRSRALGPMLDDIHINQ